MDLLDRVFRFEKCQAALLHSLMVHLHRISWGNLSFLEVELDGLAVYIIFLVLITVLFFVRYKVTSRSIALLQI